MISCSTIETHVMGLHNATAVVGYYGSTRANEASECTWFVPGTWADDVEMDALHELRA